MCGLFEGYSQLIDLSGATDRSPAVSKIPSSKR